MKRLPSLIAGLYPAGFLAAYVLLSFSATPTPIHGLWRPLVVAVLSTVALQLVIASVLRSWTRAALVTSLVVVISAAAWLILAVAAVIAAWWSAVAILRRRAGRRPLTVAAGRISDTLRVFAVAFVAVAAVPVVGLWLASADLGPPAVASPGADRPGPDIVVLLLDGSPRADALLEQFGVDNAPFEAALAQRGFTVAADSRSNYTATWATLASMTNMRYLDEVESLTPPPTDPAEQYRRLMFAINRGEALRELRVRGYELITVPSPFESASLVAADRYLDGGHLTSFELSLVQHSMAGSILLSLEPDLFFQAHRARINHAFDTMAAIMEAPSGHPRLVFAHVLAPHAPTVFEADGSPAEPFDCFPGCTPWAFTELTQWEGFPPQVEHVNSLVLATVDRIVAAAPDATIVVMSDHGSHVPGSDQANVFRTLFAARTPGWAAGLQDASPVNLFPQLFNAYMGTDLELSPYRSWISQGEAPLTMTPVALDDEGASTLHGQDR